MAEVSAGSRYWPSICGFLLLCGVAPTPAEVAPAGVSRVPPRAEGPALAAGERRIPGVPAAAANARVAPEAPRLPPPRGRPPTTPNAKLPEGSIPGQPRPEVRQLVSLSATPPSEASRELAMLASAESELFVRAQRARQPLGFEPSREATELYASGLPPLAVTPEPQPSLSLPSSDAAWLSTLRMPDLPVRMDPRVVKYLKFYRDTERGQAIARVWAKRSGRYAPQLKATFKQAGLPLDLIWLSMIESGHNPSIRSHAGALGLWQFMRGTAKMYGLRVDRWVDERLDPERSTLAAIRFLKDLHQRFGNWELAMAAYNMGYGGLSRAIRRYNTNDFWLLCQYEAGIPWETTLYVPKIMATAIVMNNKRAFGLADVALEPAEPFDMVQVEVGRSLAEVALAAGIDEAELRRLNPAVLSSHLPPDATVQARTLKLPLGRGEAASAQLASLPKPNLERYQARFGDTLRAVATDSGQSLQQLLRLNPYTADEAIQVGTALLTPPATGAAAERAATSNSRWLVALPTTEWGGQGRRVFYRVRHGDTLPEIAAAFGVSQEQLLLHNYLDQSARLHEGLVFQVFVEEGQSLEHVRHRTQEGVVVLPAGSDAFYERLQEDRGLVRLVLAARPGDTLAGIGRHYGLGVGVMERINRKSRRQKLVVGDPVVIYVKPWRKAQLKVHQVAAEPSPLPVVEAVAEEALPTLLTASLPTDQPSLRQ